MTSPCYFHIRCTRPAIVLYVIFLDASVLFTLLIRVLPAAYEKESVLKAAEPRVFSSDGRICFLSFNNCVARQGRILHESNFIDSSVIQSVQILVYLDN